MRLILEVNSLLILSAAFFMLHHVEGGRNIARGCFKDLSNNRALPVLLRIFRKDGLNWSDLSGTVIDKCQELAEKKNYKCFGIQFYGECWSGGEDACNNYDIHGTADNCLCSGSDYKPFHESPEDCVGPVGGEFSNFVYEIIKE